MFRWIRLAILVVALTIPAWSGEIEGTVTLDEKNLPQRSRNTNPDLKNTQGQYDRRELKRAQAGGDGGKPIDADVPERDFVVVFLTAQKDGAKLKATPKRTEIAQRQRTFLNHVTPVVFGSEIRFTNEDSFFHHIFCPDSAKLNAPQHATHVDRKPDRLGKFELFCDIHPLMNAFIYVVPNDFVTMAKGGKFRLTNVPPGEYVIQAWHPRVKSVSKPISVPGSGKVSVSLDL